MAGRQTFSVSRSSLFCSCHVHGDPLGIPLPRSPIFIRSTDPCFLIPFDGGTASSCRHVTAPGYIFSRSFKSRQATSTFSRMQLEKVRIGYSTDLKSVSVSRIYSFKKFSPTRYTILLHRCIIDDALFRSKFFRHKITSQC